MEAPFQKLKTDNTFDYKDGSKIWFTSDTHFSHDNIIKFCGRPYASVQEMDEDLIRRWNERIREDDIVFHLGDFAWGGSAIWTSLLNRLNGHKHLIIGNHDMKNLRSNYAQYFDEITFQKQIRVEDRTIYLNHYPFLCYGGTYRQKDQLIWQLFGHVHSNKSDKSRRHEGKDDERLKMLFPTQYDVGVDNNGYAPVSFYEVRDIIEKQISNSKQ